MRIQREICTEHTKYMRVSTQTARELYYYAEWVGRFSCAEKFYIKRSGYDSFLLLYTTEGCGTLRIGGHTYRAERGTVMLLDCRLLHEYFTVEAPWIFTFIHFKGALSEAYVRYITERYGAPVFPTRVFDMERLFSLVVDGTRDREDEALVSRNIYRILTALIHDCETTPHAFDVRAIMDYVAEHCTEQTDVGTVAARFSFSRRYFTAQFSRRAGVTLQTYILGCRMAVAAELLAATDDPVGLVAEKSGFSSPSAFIRAFRRFVGKRPLAYRKEKQEAK